MIQLQVLNSILLNKDSSSFLMNNFSSEYFSDYPNEFNFIQNHLNQYGVIPDQVTFLNKFPNFELFQVNEPVSYLISELYDDYNTRFLANFTLLKIFRYTSKIKPPHHMLSIDVTYSS